MKKIKMFIPQYNSDGELLYRVIFETHEEWNYNPKTDVWTQTGLSIEELQEKFNNRLT